MTLKNTVRNMILAYPALFRNALEAYNHLFCVIGTGYEWKNGQLVDTIEHKTNQVLDYKNTVVENIRKQLSPRDVLFGGMLSKIDNYVYEETDVEVLKKKISETITKEIEFISEQIASEIISEDEVNRRLNDFSMLKTTRVIGDSPWKVYPVSYYSALYTFPHDVKRDWLDGIKFMIEFIETHPDCMDAENYQRSMKYINEAKQRIKK